MRLRGLHRASEPKIKSGMLAWILLSCTCLLLAALGRAQKDSVAIEQNVVPGQPASIRVTSDLVLIPVTVLNLEGLSWDFRKRTSRCLMMTRSR